MEFQRFDEDTKRFVIINTTSYNNDGQYGVTVVDTKGLVENGVSEKDAKEIADGKVNSLFLTDYVGCYIMRIA